LLVIECDGNDFHEKTKEQVKKDKQRDRELTNLGYKILRFSGSEIFNNPTACAEEVYTFICNVLNPGGKYGTEKTTRS
jgi:very-short-patch-repair endonuclease